MFHMKLILVKLILAFVVVTVSLVACSGSLSEVETERLAGELNAQITADALSEDEVERLAGELNAQITADALSEDEVERLARELNAQITANALTEVEVERLAGELNAQISADALSEDEMDRLAGELNARTTAALVEQEKRHANEIRQRTVEAAETRNVLTMQVEALAAQLTAAQERNQIRPRLQVVRDRGEVICAGRDNVPGWGFPDRSGRIVGLDIDLCRAVAAAVLGDADAIEVLPIAATQRGPTIISGDVDMMVRTITWTSSRDAAWGNFAQTMFYDGQGFLVRKELDLSGALELRQGTVCVVQGTTTELFLQDFSHRNDLNISVLPFEDTYSVIQAYEEGECDAFTNDHSQLGALRTTLANPDGHAILPEYISEEPLDPVVPHGDEQWFDIVKTVMAILIYSEAYGITSDTVPETPTGSYNVDRLFGLAGSFGQETLGLRLTVARDVIGAVGNYGEIYDRNLGADGLGLIREGSRNALWQAAPCTDCPKGGQIYAAPLR